MRFIKLLALLFIGSYGFSQQFNPVSWTYDLESISGNEYMLTFTAKIDKGWTVYSQFTNDEGPVPTSINFETEGIEKIGLGKESGEKKEGYDNYFDLDVIKFLDNQPFVIKQKIKADAGLKEFHGYLTYMTCDKTKCLPPEDIDFSFSLNATKENPAETKQKKAAHSDNDKLIATKTNSANTVQTIVETKSKIEKIGADKPNNDSQDKIVDPVKWDFKIKKGAENVYILEFIADIHPEWTVYSVYSSDEGPVPTSITFDESTDYEMYGKATEEGKSKQGPDPLFDNVEVIKFLGTEPFKINQNIIAHRTGAIKGYLTYMACDSKGCLPPTDVEFVFDTKLMTAEESTESPLVSGDSGLDSLQLVLPDGYVLIDQEIPSLRASYENPMGDCEGGEDQDQDTLLWSFIFGFLGGLFALATPCVFPMIPLTVSFFTKDTKRKGWVNGMIYGLSIIVIYVSLGLFITAIFGDEALNRLSTNWIANTLFFLIFVVFAFSFFGYYEITLPSSWSTKSDTMADKGGFIGIFFMAFTLALVSFSCTGPIIGSALVSSASNTLGPAIVMFGFSLALALPFGFFAAFPSWLNTLPQSGGWMTSVKVMLGFLELAFAFKFLSVADLTNHWGFLRYEIFMGAWVIIGILTTLYLFGKIKFPHDSPIKKLSNWRKILGSSFAILTIYLATGFMYNNTTKSYNSLSMISGFPPPAQYNYFLKDVVPDQSIKENYSSYSICANNIPCFKDYYQGLEYAKSIGKPVFLDFTGHGCVNCRKTEETIWINDDIRKSLINDWVLVSLYVDDDKKLDQPLFSNTRRKKMRNIGNKWADFQITNFSQNSQPLYVMMTSDQQVLASPRGYKSDIDSYREYMNCGLKTYQTVK